MRGTFKDGWLLSGYETIILLNESKLTQRHRWPEGDVVGLVCWCYDARVTEELPRTGEDAMPRLTISLADRTHQALKETAARQNRSMGSIIEESLELRGIRPYDTAREVVAKARAKSGLNADDAMVLAVKETQRFRDEQRR